MKKFVGITLTALGVTALLMTGCAPSRLELDYGTSQELVKMNQIIYPDAGQNPAPITGVDGGAAKLTHDEYRDSFSKSKAATGSVVNQLN